MAPCMSYPLCALCQCNFNLRRNASTRIHQMKKRSLRNPWCVCVCHELLDLDGNTETGREATCNSRDHISHTLCMNGALASASTYFHNGSISSAYILTRINVYTAYTYYQSYMDVYIDQYIYMWNHMEIRNRSATLGRASSSRWQRLTIMGFVHFSVLDKNSICQSIFGIWLFHVGCSMLVVPCWIRGCP